MNINWNDGSGQSLVVSVSGGSGNGTFTISSPVNEGLDRTKTINVSSGNLKKSISVNQVGKREVFNASEGAFNLIDGTYNVMK